MRRMIWILIFLTVVLTGCGEVKPVSDATTATSTTTQTVVETTGTVSTPISTTVETKASLNESKVPITEEKQTTTVTKPDNAPPSETTTEKPKMTETTVAQTVETTTKTEWTPTVYATAKDTAEISALIVKYINEYRVEQSCASAAQLPGLTIYAEYRSTQLVSNFAHDTQDERAAATALQYGEYIDPSLYGLSGEPYYTACAREAIGMTGKIGTADEVAKHIAAMFRNSVEHWAYVGDDDYIYIGVGVTYEGCRWYCDVAMSKVNHG